MWNVTIMAQLIATITSYLVLTLGSGIVFSKFNSNSIICVIFDVICFILTVTIPFLFKEKIFRFHCCTVFFLTYLTIHLRTFASTFSIYNSFRSEFFNSVFLCVHKFTVVRNSRHWFQGAILYLSKAILNIAISDFCIYLVYDISLPSYLSSLTGGCTYETLNISRQYCSATYQLSYWSSIYCISMLVGIAVHCQVNAIYNVCHLVLHLQGYTLLEHMIHNEPYLSLSVSEFWSRRWNPIVARLLQLAFFKPVVHWSSLKGAGRGMMLPQMCTFLGSMVLHALPIYIANYNNEEQSIHDTLSMASFFIIHGLIVSFEKYLRKTYDSKVMIDVATITPQESDVYSLFHWLITMTLILGTCPLFSMPLMKIFDQDYTSSIIIRPLLNRLFTH